jgi:hypothetical protein
MEEKVMTNFERVINLIAELGKVSITSNDGVLHNMIMDIDEYDIFEDAISIGNLNGDELLIRDLDIIDVDGEVVKLKNYLLTFTQDKN